MLVKIANPIFDSVFKYLMEDLSSAQVVISRLLQKEVVELTIKRNEYTQATEKNISLYRIDFGAVITEIDEQGNERKELVTIELQKAWLPSEISRFRQYLSNQYADVSNSYIISNDPLKKQPLHIITIYLLGHMVPELASPVTYVYPKMYDRHYNPLVYKVSDIPFVDALVHDMIIVQIPKLEDTQEGSALNKLLSVFSQKSVKSNRHELLIEDDDYQDDPEVARIIRRLQSAFVDEKTRKVMQLEEEITQTIDEYENTIQTQRQEINNCIHLLRKLGLSDEAITQALADGKKSH